MVGEIIKKKREEAGMTQAELANRLSVDRSTINKIEKGVNNPSIPLLARMADVFNCSTKDFFS